MKFAAFIITYERPEQLLKTISKLQTQTRPPDKVLVIDNSISLETKAAIETLGPKDVAYHRVGFNSGPAHGAMIGMKLLFSEGYDWVFWGDDDDPPKTENAFEVLLNMVSRNKSHNWAIVGAVGHRFNWKKGEIVRTSMSELNSSDYINVDSIAGGMAMIISRSVFDANIFPDPEFFFGFEELDFCLRVKAKGYKLVVNTELFREYRRLTNRLDFRRSVGAKKAKQVLWREYYSLRNLLMIARKFNRPNLILRLYFKGLVKVMYGFRFGLSYGWVNAYFLLRALFDFSMGRTGLQRLKYKNT